MKILVSLLNSNEVDITVCNASVYEGTKLAEQISQTLQNTGISCTYKNGAEVRIDIKELSSAQQLKDLLLIKKATSASYPAVIEVEFEKQLSNKDKIACKTERQLGKDPCQEEEIVKKWDSKKVSSFDLINETIADSQLTTQSNLNF